MIRTRGLCVGLLLAVSLTGRAEVSPPAEIQRLVSELGAKTFRQRESAQKRLLTLSEQEWQTVLEQCLRAYATTTDPEIKLRAREVMAALVDKNIFNRPRAYLGVKISPASFVDKDGRVQRAIAINEVVPDSGAEQAGLRAGEQILRVDELDCTLMESTAGFVRYVQTKQPGDKVVVHLQRDGAKETIEVELKTMPVELRPDLRDPERKKEFFEDWLGSELDKRNQADTR